MTLEFETFGCRLNIAESETIETLAARAGLSDAIIFNTCAVTAEAERQARQAIRKAHRRRPDARIFVTGCASTLRPDAFAALPGVARVIANDAKLLPATWAEAAGPGREPAPDPPPRSGRTRGFVEVQKGCDHRCTFCVIPYARGDHRSVPAAEIVAAVAGLAGDGHREIVLTGVDLTAWGGDLPGRPRLGDLVRLILDRVPGLARLRLSSLDPAEIDETLWRAIAEEARLMPHLHLSAQSGDDLVLKQMKRRHSRADLLAAASRARRVRPEIALGADFIVGFPTETAQRFQRTLDLVDEAGLDYLHVFTYSPRAGTPAARLRPLPGPELADRSARLRALAEQRRHRRLSSLVGTTARVLMELGGIGHTECFATVRPTEAVPPGRIAAIRLDAVENGHLKGIAL
jgi:threonylcarbamoyladenosine tRNA methylthiotransferase MtaB